MTIQFAANGLFAMKTLATLALLVVIYCMWGIPAVAGFALVALAIEVYAA